MKVIFHFPLKSSPKGVKTSSRACHHSSHTHVPSGEVSAIWMSFGFEIMSSSGSPLSMSLRLKMITSVPGETEILSLCQPTMAPSYITRGSRAPRFSGLHVQSLLTTIPGNLHELGHHLLLGVEGRVLVDELCLNGKLLHIVCDRFPCSSIPGRQWDYHLCLGWAQMNTVIGDPEPPSPKHAAFLSLQLCSLASAAASGPFPNSYHYANLCLEGFCAYLGCLWPFH